MTYIKESSSWHRRKQRRQRITLAVVLLLLVGAGGAGYLYWTGYFDPKPSRVDVATLPPCTPASKPLTPSQVHVNVYNATKRNGIASKAATGLDLRGFGVGTISNDPLHAKVPGPAIVRYGPKGAAAAKLVAQQVTGAKLVPVKRSNAVVDLVLGTKYSGLAAIVTAPPSPTPSCRTTTPAPGATVTPTTVNRKTPGTKSTATAK